MIFTVGLHPVFKTPGLKMEGRDHFDPLGPVAVAHDMLEHFEDDDGSEEHELLAIGASWFVRNHGQYLAYKGYPKFTSTVDHLVANLSNVADTLADRTLKVPGRSYSGSDSLINSYISEAMKKDFIRLRFSPAQRDAIGELLRKGYFYSMARYHPYSASQMCEVFRSIEDQAAGFLQGAQVGDRCKITLDLTIPKATLEKVSD